MQEVAVYQGTRIKDSLVTVSLGLNPWTVSYLLEYLVAEIGP